MCSLEKYIKNSWYFINKLKPTTPEEIDKKQKWIDEVKNAQETVDTLERELVNTTKFIKMSK